MYKCYECGHIFDEGEQCIITEKHGLDYPPYERWGVCPVCGGDFGETEHCKHCFGEYFPNDLYSGICEDCLTELANVDNVFDYLADNEGLLEDFVFRKILDSTPPSELSWQVHVMCIEAFNQVRAVEEIMQNGDLSGKCRKYVLNDDGEFGKADFSEWLKERGRINART